MFNNLEHKFRTCLIYPQTAIFPIKHVWRWLLAIPPIPSFPLQNIFWKDGSNRLYLLLFPGFSPPTPPKCMSALGLQSGQVPDSSMTASSVACSPQSARLHGNPLNGKQGAWCARANNVDQWLQVDFGKYVKVQGVATQGRQNAAQWVTSYRLSYSYDGVFFKSYNDNEVFVRLPTLFSGGSIFCIKNITVKIYLFGVIIFMECRCRFINVVFLYVLVLAWFRMLLNLFLFLGFPLYFFHWFQNQRFQLFIFFYHCRWSKYL